MSVVPNADKGGEGVKKSQNFADVICGWALMSPTEGVGLTLNAELIGVPKLGHVWVFVQLIVGPR